MQIKIHISLPLGPAMLLVTYIVRLYRFQKNKPRSLWGVVEEVGVKGKKAFANYDELWDILNSSKGLKRQEKTGTRRSRIERG
jgi:hypothetical protein